MNILIDEGKLRPTDQATLFEDEEVIVTKTTDLPTLLVDLGVYKSKSKARQAGRVGDIPFGFTDKFKASKKVRLWIWRPSES